MREAQCLDGQVSSSVSMGLQLVVTPGGSSGPAPPGRRSAAFASSSVEHRNDLLRGLAEHPPRRRWTLDELPGATTSEKALRWAYEEAQTHNAELLVVEASVPPPVNQPPQACRAWPNVSASEHDTAAILDSFVRAGPR